MTALSDSEVMIAPEHEGSGNRIFQQGERRTRGGLTMHTPMRMLILDDEKNIAEAVCMVLTERL